jgi:hypothetical protein
MARRDDEEELEEVEVERLPNLDGWEYFKAIDAAESRERWTLAIKPRLDQKAIDYAFWTDIKADPEATGVLEMSRDAEKRWAKAVRRAVESSEDRALDTDARSEIALAILRQHDPTLDSYEHRLIFVLEPPPDDDVDEDEDEDEDDEDEDEDDDEGE